MPCKQQSHASHKAQVWSSPCGYGLHGTFKRCGLIGESMPCVMVTESPDYTVSNAAIPKEQTDLLPWA